jgi:hypothetical protein
MQPMVLIPLTPAVKHPCSSLPSRGGLTAVVPQRADHVNTVQPLIGRRSRTYRASIYRVSLALALLESTLLDRVGVAAEQISAL